MWDLLIFCSQPGNNLFNRLKTALKAHVVNVEVNTCATMGLLEARLSQSRSRLAAIVLVAVSREELRGLVNIQSFFDTIPLILMLPDDTRATILDAHGLFPRYIGILDDDFSELRDVLSNLLDKKVRQSDARQ